MIRIHINEPDSYYFVVTNLEFRITPSLSPSAQIKLVSAEQEYIMFEFDTS